MAKKTRYRGNKRKPKAKRHASEKIQRGKEQGTHPAMTGSGIVSLFCISIAFVVTFAFAFHYWQQGHNQLALRWALGAWIFAGIGLFAAFLPLTVTPPETSSSNDSNRLSSSDQ